MEHNIELLEKKAPIEININLKFIIYLLIFPLMIGEIFIFFYVSSGNIDLFIEISKDIYKIFAAWMIGYEVLAGLLLIKLFSKNNEGY